MDIDKFNKRFNAMWKLAPIFITLEIVIFLIVIVAGILGVVWLAQQVL